MELRHYTDSAGQNPFEEWFSALRPAAAAKVTIALVRMEQGNFSNAKGVGAGVFEFRINFGPGYRVYFGKDGEALVILLAGGSKTRQRKDVEAAQVRWDDYKRRKKGQA